MKFLVMKSSPLPILIPLGPYIRLRIRLTSFPLLTTFDNHIAQLAILLLIKLYEISSKQINYHNKLDAMLKAVAKI